MSWFGRFQNVSMNTRLVFIIAAEITVGVLLSWLPTYLELSEAWIALCTNISISVFALALFTAVIEPLSRRQAREDLEKTIRETRDEVRRLSIDQLIEALIGDKRIFDIIQRHIIRQDFILRKFRIKIQLKWLNPEKTFLLRTVTEYHLVQNLLGATAPRYNKSVSVELLYNDKYPGLTKITRIEQFSLDDVNSSERALIKTYLEDEINSLTIEVERGLKVELPEIVIPPDKFIAFETESQAPQLETDYLVYNLTRITDSLEVLVVHPDDLNVNLELAHPSSDKLQTYSNSDVLKEWVLDTGFLPHQGVRISWKKRLNSRNDNT